VLVDGDDGDSCDSSCSDDMASGPQTPPHTMQQSTPAVYEAGDSSDSNCSDGRACVVQAPSHTMQQSVLAKKAVSGTRH